MISTCSLVLSSLPDGGAKIQDHQLRLQARLQEIQAVANIRQGLANTHLDSADPDTKPTIKPEPGTADGMETTTDGDTSYASHQSAGTNEYGDGIANSPTTKRKLLDKIQVSNPVPTLTT